MTTTAIEIATARILPTIIKAICHPSNPPFLGLVFYTQLLSPVNLNSGLQVTH